MSVSMSFEDFYSLQYKGFIVCTLAQMREQLEILAILGLPQQPYCEETILAELFAKKEIDWDILHLEEELNHLETRGNHVVK